MDFVGLTSTIETQTDLRLIHNKYDKVTPDNQFFDEILMEMKIKQEMLNIEIPKKEKEEEEE